VTRTLYELQGQDDKRFSPFCWRTRMALAHKGLEATFEPVQFSQKDKIAFSNQKLVPVLRDGETVIADSWTIACYLEDKYPDAASLFGGSVGQGLARNMNFWVDMSIHPALARVIVADTFDNAIDTADQVYFRESRESRFGMTLEEFSPRSDADVSKLQNVLSPAIATLNVQPFLSGDAPAYADYILFGTVKWAAASTDRIVFPNDGPFGAWLIRMYDLFDGYARTSGAAAA
jgi:glutathione S-transferase